MYKTKFMLAMLALGLMGSTGYGQMAKSAHLQTEELSKHLNALYAKGDENSKKALAEEALALSNRKEEQFVNLAARIYQNLGQTEKAETISNGILKKFPKGLKARGQAYEKIFGDKERSAGETEKEYLEWRRRFPQEAFDIKNREIYMQAAAQMASRFFAAGEMTKGNAYVEQLKASELFPIYAQSIAGGLLRDKKYAEALPILEEAVKRSRNVRGSNNPTDKNNDILYAYTFLLPMYGEALLSEPTPDRAVELLEDHIRRIPSAANNSYIVTSLAQGYKRQGRELDAFKLMDNIVSKIGKDEKLVSEIRPLFEKMNGGKGNFEAYLAEVTVKAKEVAVASYKRQMIKRQAPDFSLADKDGKVVRLADLRGKVVVLDFWSTWCVPCKMSFPGMQAAINKYKADKDVVFLFIDTWQKEADYKTLVTDYIQKNNFSFHVLFDEMDDMKKATVTAYGVMSIPQKVVIDKEGFIRFESSGGTADVEALVTELETKIELARKGG